MTERAYEPSKWQQEFHTCKVDFLLGAGSAGVGKTVCLIADPLGQIITEHNRCADKDHPHHMKWGDSVGWALHLRRELTQLSQTIIKAQKMYRRIDPNVEWVGKDNLFIFSSGYRVQYGHCKDTGDHERYLSTEFTHVAYDELTTFEKKQVDGINSRVRSTDPVLQHMLRRVAMSNPGTSPGAHPMWVRELFVDPFPAGRKVFVKNMRRKDGTPFERTHMYMPGKLSDNPNIDFVRMYEEDLTNLPEHMRKKFLDGDWYYTAGSYYGGVWDTRIHVVRPYKIPRDWPKFRSMDWGMKSPGCIGWWAIDDEQNMICFEEFYFQGMYDADVAARIREIETRLGLWDHNARKSRITGPADTQIWEERGNSSERMVDVFRKAGVPWEQADKSPGSRATNAMRVYKRLNGHYGKTQLPGIMWFDNCTQSIATMPQLKADEDKPEEVKKGGNDHPFDQICYAVSWATRGSKAIGVRKDEAPDDEFDRALKRDNAPSSHGQGAYGLRY